MRFLAVFEKTSTGYSAYLPDLPGCIAAASTLEDTRELMRGAIEMHLHGMHKDGDPIPPQTTQVEYLEVEVPVLAEP